MWVLAEILEDDADDTYEVIIRVDSLSLIMESKDEPGYVWAWKDGESERLCLRGTLADWQELIAKASGKVLGLYHV